MSGVTRKCDNDGDSEQKAPAASCSSMSGGSQYNIRIISSMATRSSHLRQAVSIGASLSFAMAIGLGWYANRLRRSRWLETDKEQNQETTNSVINHFSSLILDPETTVEEANKRRTTSYYLKMREAHHKSLVLGVYPSRLKKLRKKEIDRTLSYWNKGNQSHRTIVCMCD